MSKVQTIHLTRTDVNENSPGTRIGFGDAIALVLLLFLILTYFPTRFWVVDTLANLLHWMLLPSLVVTIYMAVKRNWLRTGLWGIQALAFIILFGELFLPALGPGHQCSSFPDSSCRHLKVMAFNLLARPEVERQVQIDRIKDSGSDIVTLQELNDPSAGMIEDQLSELYPYQVLYPKGIAGSGILSKYPILSHEVSKLGNGIIYHARAEIDLGFGEITVVSAHPPPSVAPTEVLYNSRALDEINELIDIARESGPTLLMGDFNITDQSSDYKYLARSGLKDAHREVGWGFGSTWPALNPFNSKRLLPSMRIDQIWFTEGFVAESIRTEPGTNSDHLPVVADIVFER